MGYDTDMQTVRERERKYETSAGIAVPDLGGDGVVVDQDPVVRRLDATYFDTPDLRLSRAELALRRRTGGDDAGWHLKVGAAGATRTEHQRPLTPGPTPPADLLRLVRTAARGQPVEPVARIETRRREWRMRAADDGTVLAVVADDTVVGHDLVDGRRLAWHELEVELVDGDDALLAAVDRRLRAAGVRPASSAKVHRVLGERLARAGSVEAGAATPVLAYAAAARDALAANEPGARDGDVDAVHDMRVAVRRLRSTFQTFRALWDRETVTRLRGELRWLGEQLGAVRDAQVMAARLAKALRRHPDEVVVGPVTARVRERFAADEAAALRALRRALGSARYLDLLAALDAAVESPPGTRVRPGWVDRRIRKAVRRADRRLAAALERQADGVDDDDPALHEARKAYKRARYAVEVRKAEGDKRARRLAKRMKRLQDLLGDHQDSVVTRQALRRLATSAYGQKENTFTYGLLYGEQVAGGRALVDGLPAAWDRVRQTRL